jgi:hypothetical protein
MLNKLLRTWLLFHSQGTLEGLTEYVCTGKDVSFKSFFDLKDV